ncbi:hypothetical protein [Arthrobacter sp. GCM10027362]|uniref:hypothetical protein n=1 Tax=Arthrobacter sp. GCM10027362 TaxID=3273379 RepID=UPI00366AAB71
MHVVVQHGFEAFARVLHPVVRDGPAGARHSGGSALGEERTTWAAEAEAFGQWIRPRGR